MKNVHTSLIFLWVFFYLLLYFFTLHPYSLPPFPSLLFRRGFIMGIWNSHTSVGNILGSLIAGVWVNQHWGLSFIVPGIITAVMGVITFLFLIECEWTPPTPTM